MKKPYIIPEMTAVYTAQTLLQAASNLKLNINHNESVEADDVEVKGNSQDYDVWDDDWSK